MLHLLHIHGFRPITVEYYLFQYANAEDCHIYYFRQNEFSKNRRIKLFLLKFVYEISYYCFSYVFFRDVINANQRRRDFGRGPKYFLKGHIAVFFMREKKHEIES